RARPARRLSDPPTPGPPRGETARGGPRGGAPPYLYRLRDRRVPGGTRAGRLDGGQEDRLDRARGAAERDVPRLRAQCDDGLAGVPEDSALRPRRRNHDLDGEMPRTSNRSRGRESLRDRALPRRLRLHAAPRERQRASAGSAGGPATPPPLSAS